MAQFLGLEGRNTFSASEHIEKVKIKNGGVPQNSDLNEQAAIDEERTRNLIKEGFGNGVVRPTDFNLSYADPELFLLTDSDQRVGVLLQDGYRLAVDSASNILVANNTTSPIYKRIQSSPLNMKGRLYIVHAKEDYLDPSKKLTVRDRSDNSIQIDTAARERRLYDFYIDWAEDLFPLPALLPVADPTNALYSTPVVLDGLAVGHAFYGKADPNIFLSSPLYGYTGHVTFLGTLTQIGSSVVVDQAGMPKIDSASSNNQLFIGGDLAHRRDTETAGLVYAAPGSEVLTHSGLKASITGTYSDSPIPMTVGAQAYDVYITKLQLEAMHVAAGEQLHIPSLNAYYSMSADLISALMETGGIELEGLTLQNILDSFSSITEGETSPFVFKLVCRGTDLTNPANYKILKAGDYDVDDVLRLPIFSTESEFVIATFVLTIADLVAGTTPLIYLNVEYNGISSLYDKRNYEINSVAKIQQDFIEDVADYSIYEIGYTPGSGSFSVSEFLLFTSGYGRLVSIDTTNHLIVYRLITGTKCSSGTITGATSGATATFLSEVRDAFEDPAVAKGRQTWTKGKLLVGKMASDDSFTTEAATLSTSLARIRGALASLLPNTYQNSVDLLVSQWKNIAYVGMALPALTMKAYNVMGRLIFDAPKKILSASTAVNLIEMLFGTGTAAADTNKKQGLIQALKVTRTLRDDAGNISPVVFMQGKSVDDSPFAPFIKLEREGDIAELSGAQGGMIVLSGGSGIIAIPYADRNAYIDKEPYSGDTAVIIDGERGAVYTKYAYVYQAVVYDAYIETLTISTKLTDSGAATRFRGSDTGITGAELETLSSAGSADTLHRHTYLYNGAYQMIAVGYLNADSMVLTGSANPTKGKILLTAGQAVGDSHLVIDNAGLTGNYNTIHGSSLRDLVTGIYGGIYKVDYKQYTVPGGSGNEVILDSWTSDKLSYGVTPGYATNRITAVTAGVYEISLIVDVECVDADNTWIFLLKKNTSYIYHNDSGSDPIKLHFKFGAAGLVGNGTLIGMATLAAGDYVTAWVQQGSGANKDIIVWTANLAMKKIGTF